MTKLNNEMRELTDCELEAVSGAWGLSSLAGIVGVQVPNKVTIQDPNDWYHVIIIQPKP